MTFKKLICYVSSVAGILVAMSAHAESVCNSIEECKSVIEVSEARINAAKSKLVELQPDEIVPLGPIVYHYEFIEFRATYQDAKKYCESFGTRLPTIKEIALWMNRKGVHRSNVEGRVLQPVLNQNHKPEFYYDIETYEYQRMVR